MTIQKILYALLILGILLLVALGGYIFLNPTNTPTSTQNVPQTTSGVTTSPPSVTIKPAHPEQNTYKVTGQDGNPIAVKDFLHNKETVPDTVNPGYYFLAGSIGYCLGNGTCPEGYKTDEFTATYNTGTEQFSVALIKAPIAKARLDAEQFIMDRLGLHRIILCNLRYYVSVPSNVDSKYAGQNLGFSACPGATAL